MVQVPVASSQVSWLSLDEDNDIWQRTLSVLHTRTCMGWEKTDHIRFERVFIREQVVVAAVPRAVHRYGRHALLFTLVRRVEPR